MRHNRRPLMFTSRIAPNRVSLHPGERPQAACPVCGRWRLIERGMLRPHLADDGRLGCPGTGQRIRIDESPQRWQARLAKATHDTTRLRAALSR